jgi:hypothetical protein
VVGSSLDELPADCHVALVLPARAASQQSAVTASAFGFAKPEGGSLALAAGASADVRPRLHKVVWSDRLSMNFRPTVTLSDHIGIPPTFLP